MKKKTITTFLLALLCMTTQAQSFKLGNPNIKTQRLFIAKETVNLDYSDFTTVAVAANCDYTATSADSWLTINRMANGNAAIFAKPNYNLATRETKVTFKSEDGSVTRTLNVYQAGYDATDNLLPVASGTASSSQPGEGIERSYDGNVTTLYHSPYSNTQFPITLTYNLKEASHVDYALYTPRQDGNSNGNFMEVTVSYLVAGATTWTTLGTYDFGGSGNPRAIDFGTDGVDNVRSVRFSVKSGSGNFASCAEMQFFQRETMVSNIISGYFADNLCTQLKPGVTEEQINEIPMEELRNLASGLYHGNYSMEFRVGEFGAFRPLAQVRDQVLMTYYTYCNHENPTGITFKEGELVIAVVEGIESDGISLQVRNFGPTVFQTSRYPLRNGINIFKVNHKGNGYIDYYTTNWKKAPNVKIHFVNGIEQGYFSPKYKGHTNADWKRLLANAKGDCLDMHGERIDCVFPVSSLRANCPNDGEWLMKTYDDVVKTEHDLMGLMKYEYDLPNRMCAITVATSGGLYHASNDGFCVPVNALRDPTSRTYYDFWGAAHELGHVNQTKGFRWIGLTEVTNNVLSAYVQHELQAGATGYHRLENEANRFRYYRYLDGGVRQNKTWLPSVESDVFATLVPLWQLVVYTRIGGVQPDAFPDLYEKMRQMKSQIDQMSHGAQQVNFMRQWCHITKTNFIEFFKKCGMFKAIDQSVGDYSTAQLTITQAMLNNLQKEIESAGYRKHPPHSTSSTCSTIRFSSRRKPSSAAR